MSIKSLLQFILLCLIVLIIGGIYFLYFSSKPSEKTVLINNVENEIEKTIDNNNNQDDELLEGNSRIEKENIDKKKENKTNILGTNQQNKSVNKNSSADNNNFIKQNNNAGNKNLTKNIEYTTTDNRGNKYKILAKFGKTNNKNNNILDLEQVTGTISTRSKTEIDIKSDFASYNYNNQNSEFFDNVIIKYDKNIIFCDNFAINLNENIAVAYNNVIVESDKSIMKANEITIDILTKDIKINSNNRINIKNN